MVQRIAEVAVNVPLSKSFHYEVPGELAEHLQRGHRVLIPFGGRTATGVCVGFPEESPHPTLKPIRKVLHPDCRFDEHLLELTRWVATYYRSGWGEVLEAALPPAIRSGKPERKRREVIACRDAETMRREADRVEKRAKAQARVLRFLAEQIGHAASCDYSELLRQTGATAPTIRRLKSAGWLREEESLARRDPYASETLTPREVDPTLNADQVKAVETLHAALDAEAFRCQLLWGITGSGKTEVYLRALRRVLDRGQRGLVLLPEIALTPQTVQRFREALPETPIAVLHSMLSDAERTSQWRDIQEGRARLVIGARSAIFAPIPELRLIVVDEEHEPSYKQESAPRYHARDVAVLRASLLGIPIVLGSATPSLETWANARSGKYELVSLPRRATSHDLPHVQAIPLDGAFYRGDGSGLISEPLDRLIRRQLKLGEQTLIYLNRRGFATYVHCPQCGYVEKCAECDVSLTFHRTVQLIRCHYCGASRDLPTECPDCRSTRIRRSGVGTEKAVEEISRRYPEARVLRLDRDAITTHRSLREALAGFARGDYDILVGTQMVAKGHDFPRVSLVGVLTADTGLHFPDFRAAERTFQLITQVAGRAGRGERRGRVLVQTFCSEHYAIEHSIAGDYQGFADRELEHRRALGYPPFGRLVKLQISGKDEEKVQQIAAALVERLQSAEATLAGSDAAAAETTAPTLQEKLRRLAGGGLQILGPVPAPIARLQGKYRVQVLLKAHSVRELQRVLDVVEPLATRGRAADVSVDVDPQSLL